MGYSSTRILHVTETFASGVAYAIESYANSAHELEHHLVYAAPRAGQAATKPSDVFASVQRAQAGSHLTLARQMRSAARLVAPDVVHVHSTLAAAYMRPGLRPKIHPPIVYTPHCFAQERRDLSLLARLAISLTEKMLARRTSAYACCSPREAKVAAALSRGVPIVYVPNVGRSPIDPATSTKVPVQRIVGMGRLDKQKDPHCFLDVLQACRNRGLALSAEWIGAGTPEWICRFERANVHVTGWLSPEEVMQNLLRGGLYLHTASWEGYPLSILEAVKCRLTPVVRSVASYEGLDIPTGFKSAQEAARIIEALLDASVQRQQLGVWDRAVANNTMDIQRQALLAVYEKVMR